MYYRVGADLLVILHLGFILFVALGGLLAAYRPRLALLHLPAVFWGALIEFKGWICPLTPLEIRWRELAGQEGYRGGFIEHYLIELIYPPGLTPGSQYVLGGLLLAINAGLYLRAWHRWRRRSA
jgi:hypothetical protein